MIRIERPLRLSSFFLVATVLVVAFLSAVDGATETKQQDRSLWILKYGSDVDLDDVASLFNDSDSGRKNNDNKHKLKVERQLKCSSQRGLVVSFEDEESRLAFENRINNFFLDTESISSMDLVLFDTTLEVEHSTSVLDHHDHRLLGGNGVKDPQGDGECDYKTVCREILESGLPSKLTQNDVDIIKAQIKTDVTGDGDSVDDFDGSVADNAGALLRLVFHDAASFDKNDAANLSGLNGCVNKNNVGNDGLQPAQAYIGGLQGRMLTYHGIDISIPDLIVLAAISALEVTSDISIAAHEAAGRDYAGSLDIEFKYGRPEIDCQCEEDFLPPALSPDEDDDDDDDEPYSFKVLDETMRDTMGFTRTEITALMGTHTLGAMERSNSGFPASSGERRTKLPWVIPGPLGVLTGGDGFDNGYYTALIGYPWNKKEVVVGDTTIVEWIAGGRFANFLNSDGSLGFELDFVDPTTGTLCNTFGGSCVGRDGTVDPNCILCPPLQNAYGVATRFYAEDQAAWLKDYSKAFQKMIDDMVPCRQVKLLTPEES